MISRSFGPRCFIYSNEGVGRHTTTKKADIIWRRLYLKCTAFVTREIYNILALKNQIVGGGGGEGGEGTGVRVVFT